MVIEELYEYVNQMAAYVISSPETYSAFLRNTSKVQGHTVSNRLIISGYTSFEDVGYLKDLEEWQNEGGPGGDKARMVYIMKHNPDNVNVYEPRPMVAITEDRSKLSYDKGYMVERLMMAAPCRIEYDDQARNRALYVPDTKRIRVTKGFKSYEQVFFELSREYAHAVMHSKMEEVYSKDKTGKGDVLKLKYPRLQNDFIAYSAAYAIAARYDMLPQGLSINQLPENWTGLMEPKEIKKELGAVITVLNALDIKMMEELKESQPEMLPEVMPDAR